MDQLRCENQELRIENEELVRESVANTRIINELREKVRNMELTMERNLRQSGSSSDVDSVGSQLSNMSIGGSLPEAYSHTGYSTKVSGVMYPIVQGPGGALYIQRPNGRIHRLSAKQDRDKIPT